MRPKYTYEATYRPPNEPPPDPPTIPAQLAYTAAVLALVWMVAHPSAALAVVALVPVAVLCRRVGGPGWLPRPTRSVE